VHWKAVTQLYAKRITSRCRALASKEAVLLEGINQQNEIVMAFEHPPHSEEEKGLSKNPVLRRRRGDGGFLR
jgi:hypothetical protein